jgi:hypothetical protein
MSKKIVGESDIIRNLRLVEEGKALDMPLSVLNGELKRKWFEPIIKARERAYNQKPEVKAKRKAYQRAYNQNPENKARERAYQQKPEVKAVKRAYMKVYNQKPENKAKKKAYDKARYKRIKKVNQE